MAFQRFSFNSLDEIQTSLKRLNLELPFSDAFDSMQTPVKIGGKTAPNSWACHPMEGCDGSEDGSPGELTHRRYKRFAQGGAGLLWVEAIAVRPEGKAVPRQLFLDQKNVGAFAALRESISQNARESGNEEPICLTQLTYSGRFSKPGNYFAPKIVQRNPTLDPLRNITTDDCIISDDELKRLEDAYVETAILAEKAGFDGVDLKACHLYLISELLGGFNRKGEYGGSYEGRTRFLRNIFAKVKSAVGKDFILACRLNFYDGIPHPYGWGMNQDGTLTPDFTEPLKLVGQLIESNLALLNITMGTPYYNPHVNRPYDQGGYEPPEEQLRGVHRLLSAAKIAQATYPKLPVVATGFSWLRQFAPYLAAGCKTNGWATFIGLGRQSFAYPDFPNDLKNDGVFHKEKCCICCGKCAELLRASRPSGCVVRDRNVYDRL